MTDRSTSTILPLALALALGSLSCSREAELTPASGAAHPRASEAAFDEQNGVRVTAAFAAWPGDALITREVTPVRVVIENGSEVAVQIRYESFQIVAADRTVYRALPPFDVRGVVPATTPSVGHPSIGYTGFNVAPRYGAIYDIDPYVGPFPHHRRYHETYFPYWTPTTLPTKEMLRRALPEGVVQPDGHVSGFLYFQKIDDDEGSVSLNVHLVAAENDELVTDISLGFIVD